MKYCGTIFFLLLLSLQLNAQLLELKNNWFDLKGFFVAKEVENKQIKSIDISRRTKSDGRRFKNVLPFLSYQFFDNGLIRSSQQYTPVSNGIDTATFFFYYDRNELLYKRIEKQGPFKFDYYFFNEEGLVAKEIKIDGNSPNYDTSYIRFYKHEKALQKLTSTAYNSARKPFMQWSNKYDSHNRLIRQKQSYTRSSNYRESTYTYQLEWLLKKEERSYIGEERIKTWSYTYKQGKLDMVTLKWGATTTNKYGVSYLKNGLVDVIVERNMVEKTITVYQFSYTYFD